MGRYNYYPYFINEEIDKLGGISFVQQSIYTARK